MNIQISDKWLREFIETPATTKQIKDCLSLCGQSVERINKNGDDSIYDIEITTNRPDCLSVYGIARELCAILPRFKIPCKMLSSNSEKIESLSSSLPLEIKISNPGLCPRFTALIFDNITIKPSPEIAQKRLIQSGIRALNNVIDISNYLMLELGQPMHTFDYDKILKNKMFLREAKNSEEIITLDGEKRKLKDGVIIIEDGEKRIIDLCGIMGAKNSETDEKTKRVLLFVQTYNPMKIRKATQALAFRTEAAARFEKGIDPQGVVPTMERSIVLFKEWCGAKQASNLFDIYPSPQKEKSVEVEYKKIKSLMGIDIPISECVSILESLNFECKIENEKIIAKVPHFRYGDVSIEEDLIEEIARIYGYHNVPNILPPLPENLTQSDSDFYWEDIIKDNLKSFGFTETMSYSMVGKNLLEKAHIEEKNCVKISNPLVEDLTYLRTSIIPSLLEIISSNQEEKINIFEMANIYIKTVSSKLPEEKMTLSIASTEKNFFELKGILEVLFKQLGINSFSLGERVPAGNMTFNSIIVNDVNVGILGEVGQGALSEFKIKQKVLIIDIELKRLFNFVSKSKKYIPNLKYPAIVEDMTFNFPKEIYFENVIEEIKKQSNLIVNVELLDSYNEYKTLRIYYQSEKNNLSDKETLPIRQNIIEVLEKKFEIKLKA